jgi:hypothetical protein
MTNHNDTKPSKAIITLSLGWVMWPLTLLFVILKLTGVIAWSWWWVTSPLWLPWAIVVVLIVAVLALSLLMNAWSNLPYHERD